MVSVRTPPKPLIRFILVATLLLSMYIIYLMASGMRRSATHTGTTDVDRPERKHRKGPPRVKHIDTEEDEEDKPPVKVQEEDDEDEDEGPSEKELEQRRQERLEEERREEKRKEREQEERKIAARKAEERREKERIEKEEKEEEEKPEKKEEKKPVKKELPSNFYERTDEGRRITLMNPFHYANDQRINCVPLQSAADKEAICTYRNSQDQVISKVLNRKHVWQGPVVNTMKQILDRNPQTGLIDIGANLGVFTLTAASMNHKVVGVEPFPPNLKHLAKSLRQNAQLMKLVKIVVNPVSNQYEMMRFWARDKQPGDTQVHSKMESKELELGNHEEVEDMQMPSILTDDLLALIDFKRAIMKVDIAGGEYKALQSSYRLFDELNISHVFMEWKSVWESQEKRDFFLAFFKVRNYSVHKATPQLEPLEFSHAACKDWPFDVVFIKQS